MKLYSPEEIVPEVTALFDTQLSDEAVAQLAGRQYVCSPEEYVRNRLGGTWTADAETANQYLYGPNFVLGLDRPLEEVTKRFIVFTGVLEPSQENSSGFKIVKTQPVMEFNSSEELDEILVTHESLIKDGLGYSLFETIKLRGGGHGVSTKADLVARVKALTGEA
jgi:hypothetical protein